MGVTRRDALLALAARVEAAAEGSILLDQAVDSHMIPALCRVGPGQHWTQNTDAALALVPERWKPMVQLLCSGGALASLYLCDPGFWDITGIQAATPPLAVCAAALRAMAAMEEE